MTAPRVVETDQGIVGEFTVQVYDQMQRRLRDRGWIETDAIVRSGIDRGRALEIGPGPGYLGLEWLKATGQTRLVALDISEDMIALATRNAAEYGLSHRVEYVRGRGDRLPFADGSFDAVFSNGSLHEWANPAGTLDEIWRVLRAGGRYFVSDLRRDMRAPVRWFLWIFTRPRAIRPGLISSIRAAYTPAELADIARASRLADARVSANPIGVTLSGMKAD